MSLADLQAQIDCLTLRVRALELEVRRTPRSSAEDLPSASTTSGYQVPEAPEESSDNHGSLTWDQRLEVARHTGDFFLRCLEGANRGSSGQTQIGLPKRIYVLVRDNRGNVFRGPVRTFVRYSDIKPLVEVGTGFGSSVFAGFASQREAREAVLHAGFGWPSSTSA